MPKQRCFWSRLSRILCLSALLALWVTGLTACFDVDPPAVYACNNDHPDCPTGHVCINNSCTSVFALDAAFYDATPDAGSVDQAVPDKQTTTSSDATVDTK